MADFPGIVKGLIASFGACVCFAMLFHAPKRSVVPAALIAMAGYAVYMAAAASLKSTVGASFLSALVVAVLAEILAKRMKMPAVVFSMVGIVPIVPGAGLYRTMLSLVLNEFANAVSTGVETLLVSAAIAMAVAVTTLVFRSTIRKRRGRSAG